MIGRTAALLVDLPVEIVPSGWRISAPRAATCAAPATCSPGTSTRSRRRPPATWGAEAPGRRPVDARRGRRAAAPGQGRHRPRRGCAISSSRWPKVAPRTWPTSAPRVPGARLVLQLDEPSLPAVLAGASPRRRATAPCAPSTAQVAEQALRDVLEVAPAGGRVVHCCAADVADRAAARGRRRRVCVDASLLGPADYDALGEAVDAGVSLWLGVVPATEADVPSTAPAAPMSAVGDSASTGAARRRGGRHARPAGWPARTGLRRRVLGLLRDVGRDLLDPS